MTRARTARGARPIFGLVKDNPVTDWVSGGGTIAADCLNGIFAMISAGLADAEWEQWVADVFSNVGGLIQGIGEICAVATKISEGPAKVVAAAAMGAFVLSGFALAETGTGFYIYLAVKARDTQGVAFTNPGG